MNSFRIIKFTARIALLLFATLSVAKANDALSGTGSITNVSGGSVEIEGKKYQFRSTTKVLDENGSALEGQTISKLSTGEYLEFKARDNEPYPRLLWVRLLMD